MRLPARSPTPMKSHLHPLVRHAVPVLLLVSFASGCALLPRPEAGRTRTHAFIAYWPHENSGRLRLAVKDLIDMKGVVTTAGSEYLAKNSAPATRDAKCLRLARERQVDIVGKANLTEFAVATSGINSYYGTPRNRLDGKHLFIPGGSSCGSAVAVASGQADVAFGTDTAGSIRVPAACCGVLGLKTTFGLVPLQGVFPISPEHLDTVGPMAKDMRRLVQGMDLLQEGFAGRYAQAVAAHPSARQIRIGRLYLDGTDPAIDKAVDDALAAKHFKVTRLSESFKKQWQQAMTDAFTVALADTWLHDKQYIGKPGVTSKTEATIILGRIEYPGGYQSALKRRAAWQRALRQVFAKVDFIALPTLQSTPPRVPWFGGNALFELAEVNNQNTQAVNFAGNPALAVPIPLAAKKEEAHPVTVTSLQIVGPRLSEAALLNVGRLVESKTR